MIKPRRAEFTEWEPEWIILHTENTRAGRAAINGAILLFDPAHGSQLHALPPACIRSNVSASQGMRLCGTKSMVTVITVA